MKSAVDILFRFISPDTLFSRSRLGQDRCTSIEKGQRMKVVKSAVDILIRTVP